MMKDYRKLRAWQAAHELVMKAYLATEKFPSKEIYGLTSQLRRAAVSIPTNIAEGYGRSTDTDIARFMDISLGSINELEYLLFLSNELKYISKEAVGTLFEKINEVRKMLTVFAKTLRGQKAGSR